MLRYGLIGRQSCVADLFCPMFRNLQRGGWRKTCTRVSADGMGFDLKKNSGKRREVGCAIFGMTTLFELRL